ncbi:MAG: hypothetical protein AAF821_18150 [Cyanobacteria bacterium P01_D01_bin.156]
MDEHSIQIQATLTAAEALAIAQFMKRATFDDYLRRAVDSDEAYTMIAAASKIREALAVQDIDPR